jgi:hypothetical protein
MLFEYGYCKREEMKTVMKQLRKKRKAESKVQRNIIEDLD